MIQRVMQFSIMSLFGLTILAAASCERPEVGRTPLSGGYVLITKAGSIDTSGNSELQWKPADGGSSRMVWRPVISEVYIDQSTAVFLGRRFLKKKSHMVFSVIISSEGEAGHVIDDLIIKLAAEKQLIDQENGGPYSIASEMKECPGGVSMVLDPYVFDDKHSPVTISVDWESLRSIAKAVASEPPDPMPF